MLVQYEGCFRRVFVSGTGIHTLDKARCPLSPGIPQVLEKRLGGVSALRWKGHELTSFASLYQLTPDRSNLHRLLQQPALPRLSCRVALVCAMIRIASLRDTEVMQRGFDLRRRFRYHFVTFSRYNVTCQ
jgi:hypothetical protein